MALFKFNTFPQEIPEQVRQKQFQDAVEGWEREPFHTPDILSICRKELIPVLVYCEVMTGKHMNGVIAPGGAMMHGFTAEKYFMLRKEKGRNAEIVIFEEGQIRGKEKVGLLASLLNTDQLVTAPVRGELHMLTSDQVIDLDNYKENGVKFQRKRVPITIPHRYKKQTEDGGLYTTPTISKTYSAYLYVGVYDEHFEHWHMTDANRILASIPLVKAKVPYYYNL